MAKAVRGSKFHCPYSVYAAELKFRMIRGRAAEEAAEAVNDFVCALCRNGQVLSTEWPMPMVGSAIHAFISIPARDALARSHENRWVRERRSKLRAAGVSQPRARVLGPEPDSSAPCCCKRSGSYLLVTDCLSMESPLRCGDCFGPVPLYLIPHTSEFGNYEDVRFWQQEYQACDYMWLRSGAGERLGYREMAKHDSDLSEEGRGLCRRIEKSTRAKTFYYLFRYYGRSPAAERKRRCPVCGGKWFLADPWHERYAFRCERCRLVSRIAADIA